jgi:hypothetical protein
MACLELCPCDQETCVSCVNVSGKSVLGCFVLRYGNVSGKSVSMLFVLECANLSD